MFDKSNIPTTKIILDNYHELNYIKNVFRISLFLLFLFINFLNAKDIVKIYIISNFPADKDVIYSANLSFNEFKNNNKNIKFKLKFIPLNDSWSKNNVKNAIITAEEEAKYIIFTSTSTSFLEIYNLIKNKNILIFACGPTTTKISQKDDNVIRNIPDADNEQKQIANYFNKNSIKKLLILRENKFNPKYTEDAIHYFKKYYKGNFKEITFSAYNLNIDLNLLKTLLSKYQSTYILSGSALNEVALLIKLIKNLNSKENIYLTPWENIKIIKKIVKSKSNIFYFTYIDKKNEKLKNFLNKFYLLYNHYPSFITSYLTYEIVSIISEAFSNINYLDLTKVKSYILSHQFNSIFGVRSFDKYGDSNLKLHLKRLSD